MTVMSKTEIELMGQFMRGDAETKAFLLDEVMGLMSSLLAELNSTLVNGTKDEKKAILTKIKFFRKLIQLRSQRMKEKLNISNEDLNQIVQHFVASSPNVGSKLNNAKQEMDAQKSELNKFVLPSKKKLSSVRVKSKWIRS